MDQAPIDGSAMHPYNRGSIWAVAMVEILPDLQADDQQAFAFLIIALILAAGGYAVLIVANFNDMLKSLKFAAALQRLMSWTFIVVGLALALASSWIIVFD